MIFFLHIPKTAGTTFYDVVKVNHNTFLKPKMEDNPFDFLNNTILNEKTAIRLPGGYVSAPQTLNIIHEQISHRVQYISFLKDPRERLISDYKEHCKKGRYLYKILLENDFDFNVYLKALKANHLDNILTRQLAGPTDFFLEPKVAVDDVLADQALKNSRSIIFFRIEDFKKALQFYKKEFGWKKIKYQRRNQSNAMNADLEIDEDLLSEIIIFDLKLYNSIMSKEIRDSSLFKRLFGGQLLY